MLTQIYVIIWHIGWLNIIGLKVMYESNKSFGYPISKEKQHENMMPPAPKGKGIKTLSA